METKERLLKYKDRGPEVVKLQKMLKELGLFSGPITGYFGPLTLKAVLTFQRRRGLRPDGLVGAATWRELLILAEAGPGKIIFRSDRQGVYNLYWFNFYGVKIEPLTSGLEVTSAAKVSPDGKNLAFINNYREIWLLNLTLKKSRKIFRSNLNVGEFSWNSDGRKLVFDQVSKDGAVSAGIFILNIDTGQVQKLTDGVSPNWGRIREEIIFNSQDGKILAIRPNGSGERVILRPENTGGPLWLPKWSWDNSFVAATGPGTSISIIRIFKPDGSGMVEVASGELGKDYLPTWANRDNLLAYLSQKVDYSYSLKIVKAREANAPQTITTTNRAYSPAWNKGDHYLAFTQKLDKEEIFIVNILGTKLLNITKGFGNCNSPTWVVS